MNKSYQELCDEIVQLREQLEAARLLMAGTLGIGPVSLTPPITKEYATLEAARRMERQVLEQRYVLAHMTARLSMAKAEQLEREQPPQPVWIGYDQAEGSAK
ncbi:hypothetical protein [Modicisalibacter radicis]|uniref:hypothetical protein n=1 Tax=Halomonas sp. EAR18 TaxID=2518972 RepID=UPI00109D0E92|nr:hypothetical protein [Halomonas sp. EAR18]